MKDLHKNILVVEDCPDILEPLRLFLSSVGFNIIYAKNGQDALKLLEENSVDLVITDVHMPKMNGLELTKRICKMKLNKLLIIIMTSDESVLEKESKNKFSNPVKFIKKPFNHSEINETIKQIL